MKRITLKYPQCIIEGYEMENGEILDLEGNKILMEGSYEIVRREESKIEFDQKMGEFDLNYKEPVQEFEDVELSDEEKEALLEIWGSLFGSSSEN